MTKKPSARQLETPIEPDPEDIEAVKREYGPLPRDATTEQRADRWRDYQAQKLIRVYGQKFVRSKLKAT
jgi:hypothetical protein